MPFIGNLRLDPPQHHHHHHPNTHFHFVCVASCPVCVHTHRHQQMVAGGVGLSGVLHLPRQAVLTGYLARQRRVTIR